MNWTTKTIPVFLFTEDKIVFTRTVTFTYSDNGTVQLDPAVKFMLYSYGKLVPKRPVFGLEEFNELAEESVTYIRTTRTLLNDLKDKFKARTDEAPSSLLGMINSLDALLSDPYRLVREISKPGVVYNPEVYSVFDGEPEEYLMEMLKTLNSDKQS